MDLNGIIANNDLMVVKIGLENMIGKLKKQSKKNIELIEQLENDCKRLEDAYLYFNNLKFEMSVKSDRNRDLESLLISNINWNIELKKENEELEKQLIEIKKHINI